MKTFPSYDNTICKAEDCPKKETCVRYLTYQQAVNEKYPYRLSVKMTCKGKCEIYVKAE